MTRRRASPREVTPITFNRSNPILKVKKKLLKRKMKRKMEKPVNLTPVRSPTSV